MSNFDGYYAIKETMPDGRTFTVWQGKTNIAVDRALARLRREKPDAVLEVYTTYAWDGYVPARRIEYELDGKKRAAWVRKERS